jgi:hypothetical protein
MCQLDGERADQLYVMGQGSVRMRVEGRGLM